MPLNDPALFSYCDTFRQRLVHPSSGRRSRTFIAWFKVRQRNRWHIPECLRVPCGSRTRLARLEAWNLCRSAKGTVFRATTALALHPRYRSAGTVASGRRESRTLKAYRSTAFEAAAVANRLALPFLAAEAGIEPASRRLTVAFPYQHRTHRIVFW